MNLEEGVLQLLEVVGIKAGQVVLDFGCGSGTYTVPAARIVGDKGKVYALDKDSEILNELMQKLRSAGLANVKTIDTHGEVKIDLADDSVDVVLLYDIFWYFPLRDAKLTELLDEVYRVSKPDALLSVYPKHIDSGRLREKIERCGFTLRDVYSEMLLHNSRLEKGELFNFARARDIPPKYFILNGINSE